MTINRNPQAVFATEPLVDVLRQLQVYGKDGLPVLTEDGRHIEGWITTQSALEKVTQELGSPRPPIAGRELPDALTDGQPTNPAAPSTPLTGYQIVEVTITAKSAHIGQKLSTVSLPAGYLPVSSARDNHVVDPSADFVLRKGDRINLLARIID